MDFTTFKKSYSYLPFIISRDLFRQVADRQVLLNQLNRWQEKGLIIKLRRGMYILNENERKVNPSRFVIANQLYVPSYISLESALGFYGLIPERVVDITCVTSKKTMHFRNTFGNFIYQHIKPQGFRGFTLAHDDNGLNFFIAEPEKTVVDFLYLNMSKISSTTPDIFNESFRFQNTERLKMSKIISWARMFDNAKLMGLTHLFCEFIGKRRRQ